jgi:ribosome-binding ATPase YchF (GTP1/OBG family)
MNKNLLIFIIVALAIVGVVYFLSTQNEAEFPQLQEVSNDSSISTIERELDTTDLDTLDSDFEEIDKELEAALEEAQ